VLFFSLSGSDFPELSQPLPYSHKTHVEELEIACEDCHANTRTHERALIPNIDTCSVCHVDTEAEDPGSRAVAEYVEREQRIPWRQVHGIPDYAYFSHRRHVALAGIDCPTCHGPVREMESPFAQPFLRMDMDWCVSCHEERSVSNDCYNCHR